MWFSAQQLLRSDWEGGGGGGRSVPVCGPERGAHVKLSPGSSHHVNFDGISTAGGKRGRESVEVLVLTDSTSGPPEVVGNQC